MVPNDGMIALLGSEYQNEVLMVEIGLSDLKVYYYLWQHCYNYFLEVPLVQLHFH